MKLLLLVDENLTRAQVKKNLESLDRRHNPLGIFEELHIVDSPLWYSGTTEIGKNVYLHSTKRWLGLGYIAIIFKVIGIIKKEKIDIIKINYSRFLGLLGIVMQKVFKIPCVAGCYNDYRTWHKLFPFDRIYATLILEKLIYRNAKFVFFQSQYMKDYLLALGVREEQFKPFYRMDTHIENFYNCERHLDKRYFTLVFCGRLHNQKDVWTLLKGFKELRQNKQDARLWLIGDGPLRSKLERFVEKNNINGVTFFGFIENKEVRKRFETADLFVFTSLFEGTPNVFLEAQAAGMPIVTTNIPHLSNMVNRENAYFFPARDYKELARILLKLYRNEEELLRLSQASLKKSAEFFSQKPFERNAQTYREIYEESKSRA